MSELNVKYQLGTKENEAFLADVREGLFSFGHNFPAPGGSSYYLGDDGTRGKIATVRHGSPAVSHMYTAWHPSSVIPAAKILLQQRSKVCAANCMILQTAAGMPV